MKTILFYIFFITTRLIASLPLKGIHVISDIAYFFTYYIFRYRRKTVEVNLRNSFPEKSPIELKRIEKAFYKHFSDLFWENIYMFHASKEDVIKMCKFNNIEILQKYYPKGKSVIIATGHYSNWELFCLFAHYLNHKVIGIYKPVENKKFEGFINNFREKFGAIAVPMHDAFRTVMSYNNQGKLFFLGLISDQTPARSEIHYWTTFLNQDTPVFLGVEKIAVKTNQPVFFCKMRKVARGQYEVDIDLLCENPKETEPYEITEMHVRALEKLINEAPEYWLWSHRRWKFKRVGNTIQRQKIG
jgi:Kdo2-lipid IVA lauroyltransferase/acyltransferase